MDERSLSLFVDAAIEAHASAAQRIGVLLATVNLGGLRVRIHSCGEELHDRLSGMLLLEDSAAIDGAGEADIYAFDSATGGVDMPTPPWTRSAYQLGNEIAGLRHGRFLGSYMLDIGALNLCDRSRRLGVYWAASAPALRLSQEAVPLRNILHWLAADHGVQLTHAAAVGHSGDGILILGAKGVGKSTTSLAGMLAGLDLVADDFCLVAKAGREWRATPLTRTARVTRSTLTLLPELADRVTNFAAPADHKAEIVVDDRLCAGLSIRALTTPVRADVTEDPRRVDRTTFVRSVMAGTVGVFPGMSDGRLRFLAELSEHLPCYELPIGPDLRGVDELVTGLVESHRQVPV